MKTATRESVPCATHLFHLPRKLWNFHPPPDTFAGIVSFEIEGNAEAIAAALAERNIIVSVKDGHIRASVQFYNDEDDLERFLGAISDL